MVVMEEIKVSMFHVNGLMDVESRDGAVLIELNESEYLVVD